MALKNKLLGSVVVTTAGTRVQVSASTNGVLAIAIQAKKGNSGNIFVGDSTVSSSNGHQLGPGDWYFMNPVLPNSLVHGYRLSDIYIDAAVNAEGVIVSYLTTVRP